MRVSGDIVSDVASTGGPSSISTLLSPLYLRSAGALVPKLGVPGRPAGGIDCLAQIPGYQTELPVQRVREILDNSGYAHFRAEGAIAPLDGRMFRLRQTMGAQAIPSLVVASILAKKLAVGVKHAGLDIRVAPHGNFGGNMIAATVNAKIFSQAARILHLEATPILTDARYPYQPYIGRRESLVALDAVFRGAESSWLQGHKETCRSLAIACLPANYRGKVVSTPPSELRAHFDANLLAQGATPEGFEDIVKSTREQHRDYITASGDGFCFYDLNKLRNALTQWQSACRSTQTLFPDPVGVVLLSLPGQWVTCGTPLATVRAPAGMMKKVIIHLRQIIGTPQALPSGPSLEAIYG